jgi:hypothetical protein
MSDLTLTETTLLKVLNEDGTYFHHSAQGRWSLPKGDRPGAWKSIKGPLVPCANGLHLCRLSGLPRWLGPALFIAEHDGERIDVDDNNPKVVVRKARLLQRVETWNERTMRLLACDYAEHVLSIYEQRHPNGSRPRAAIQVARRFANGEATQAELNDAANAAYTASANAAAYVAAYAANAANAAANAAAYAANAAAYARATEQAWQLERLRTYLSGAIPEPVGVIEPTEGSA